MLKIFSTAHEPCKTRSFFFSPLRGELGYALSLKPSNCVPEGPSLPVGNKGKSGGSLPFAVSPLDGSHNWNVGDITGGGHPRWRMWRACGLCRRRDATMNWNVGFGTGMNGSAPLRARGGLVTHGRGYGAGAAGARWVTGPSSDMLPPGERGPGGRRRVLHPESER